MNKPETSTPSNALAAVVQFFASDVAALTTSLSNLEHEIDAKALPQLNDRFHQQVLEAFELSQVACRSFEQEHLEDSAAIKVVQDGFRRQTDAWFSQSWIAHRARTKPNGFVGDFEMLIKLYDEKTPARGLGGYLDLCILDLPLARAVRTRLRAARKFILDELSRRLGNVRILDVASGPCREFLHWPNFANQTVEVIAMDTDPEALDYVQTNVCPTLPQGTTLKPVRYNALRTTSAANTISRFGRFDIIYSVGLCDYLTDDQLIRMLAAWRETLNDDGVMYVAFKDCEQYDHTPYQWHLDWFFYQRTHEDVLRLLQKAGFKLDTIEITKDETGIITNYVARRITSPSHRIDRAEAPTMSHSVRANTESIAKQD
jgi:extracellular factor (EF) 3-hydroxypalmitic acid methyl ester biosynthesis protein